MRKLFDDGIDIRRIDLLSALVDLLTHAPAQVKTAGVGLDPAHTLFVVASKSGSTLEPKVFLEHFLAQTKAKLGDAAGKRFVAITDPGSKRQQQAEAEGFRRVFFGRAVFGLYSTAGN